MTKFFQDKKFITEFHGILQMLRTHYYKSTIEQLSELAIVILHVLNFEPGISLCFYSGMTELSKTGLNFALPLYYLTIVVVVIILCRFSPKLSNRIAHSSVQALVTVAHLCILMIVSLLVVLGLLLPYILLLLFAKPLRPLACTNIPTSTYDLF